MLEDIKDVKGKVEQLLRDIPKTRDSDKELQIHFLQKYCKMELSHLQQLKFRNAPSMESIRRVRADMQNTKGIYKAIPVVQKARKVEEAKVRGEMMGGHQEKLI